MSRLSVGIVLILLAAAAVFFLLVPQWNAVSALRADVSQLQSLSSELDQLGTQRDALIKEYTSISEADLKKVAELAPRDSENSSALVDLDTLASSNGLALSQIDFTNTASAGATALKLPATKSYGEIPVSLSLRGTYDGFRKFLTGLEHNLRLVDVTDINLGAAPGGILTISVKAKLYYQP